MKFKVNKENDSFEISSNNLFELISNQILKKQRDDHIEMSKVLLDYLKVSNSLSSVSLGHLVTLAFSLGYFYRIFFEKNNIEIIENNKNETNDSDNEQ